MGRVCPVMKFFITTFLYVVTYDVRVNGESILFLSPLSTPSHENFFEPLIQGLVEGGHEVTLINNKKAELVTQVMPLEYEGFMSNLTSLDNLKKPERLFLHIIQSCHQVFRNQKFQEAMGKQYDLIIVNGYLNDCFYGFLYKMNTPFIILTSSPAPSYILETVGTYNLPSFVPVTITDFSDQMNFLERLKNFGYFVLAKLFVKFKMLGGFEEVYRQHLGEELPGVQEILSNASIIMMNSHFFLNRPRPYLPDVIEIGGIHCRPAKPLPQDLDAFVSESKDGVIYFSLGSLIQSQNLPKEVISIFVNVFSCLPQRVVWKMDMDEVVKDALQIPSNVKLFKWVPQQDLLGHPNTKLFISHGGLLSVQEAVFHSVPVLGIPFTNDQHINLRKATDLGVAVTLKIADITEETLSLAINSTLRNVTYDEKAKLASQIFRDREISPLQVALFWTEYVLRHKGAKHLRSGARLMNLFQYHSLDVISAFLIIFWCIYVIVRKLMGTIF